MSSNAKILVKLSEEDEPLETTYYCQAERAKILNVVMALEGETGEEVSLVPQRFVLVIDISGSMDGHITQNDPYTLLQRMQIFAKQFIENTTQSNWISIVTFSNVAYTNMPMTQMTTNGKQLALNAISNLYVENSTNLSDGLFRGLDMANSPFPGNELHHDCIILFTDGEANEGIVEPSQLITEYKRRMHFLKAGGRINTVQLAAVTFDNYRPFLLSQLRQHLSSDAFYVLNCNCDFEADMLLPLFLRQSSYISELEIDLTCLGKATFVSDNLYQPGLKAVLGNTGLQYFIHTLPRFVKKHIFLSLDISNVPAEGHPVLQVKKSYLDPALQQRKSVDHINLILTPMSSVAKSEGMNANLTKDVLANLEQMSSYVVARDEVFISWHASQLAFANVSIQKGRNSTLSSVSNSSYGVDNRNIEAARKELNQSIGYLNNLQQSAVLVLGKENSSYKRLVHNLDSHISNLNYGMQNMEHMPWARLMAMASSLETEMPTPSGVFEPSTAQPFMPPEIEEKIAENTKVLQHDGNSSNQYRQRLYERHVARRQLNEAIQQRSAESIETCLGVCVETGVDEKTIFDGEQFLDHVKKEDLLISEISMFLQKRDVRNLGNSLEKFRDPKSQFVDKTGVADKAELFIKRDQADGILKLIGNSRQNDDEKEMEKLIKALKESSLQAVVEKREVERAEKELEILRFEISAQKRYDNVKASIQRNVENEDTIELERCLNMLKEILNETHFRDKEEARVFYQQCCQTLITLEEKSALVKEIAKTWEQADLPFHPESLNGMKEILQNIEEKREQASEYKDAFTDADAQKLDDLKLKIQDLEEKIVLRDEMESKMKEVIQERQYKDIVASLKQAEDVLFVDPDLIVDGKELAAFLFPAARIKALKLAYAARNIRDIEQAISDFRNAGVVGEDELLQKSEKRLKKLRKIEKLNNLLEKAIQSRDLATLRDALMTCDKSRVNNNDIPLYAMALDTFGYLSIGELKDILNSAIENRELNALNEAITFVDNSDFKEDVNEEYEKAKELQSHLLELLRLRQAILGMDDSLVSEIKGYINPPQDVLTVMTSVFIILGEPSNIAWSKIQVLMKNTAKLPLRKRIFRCQPEKIGVKQCSAAERLIENLDVAEVQSSSKGAAAFYAWVRCMIIESKYYNR